MRLNHFIPRLALIASFLLPIKAAPVISEFVADNKDSYEDEDLESSDWIEIFNNQNSSQNLAGYYLTTDPTKTLLKRRATIPLPF